MQTDEHRLGDAGGVVDAGGVEGLLQDGLDATPVVGVEAVARHEHERGEEAAEGVAADEEPHPLALAEMEDAHRDVDQLVDRDLEQLIPWEGLEDLDQRLLVVAAGREGGSRQDGLDLSAEDRDLAWTRVVGGVRVEAQETALADHPPVGVDSLDSDVVEIRRAVNRRARVCLGEVQQVGLERQRPHFRRQALEPTGAGLAAGLAQNAEPAVRDGVEPQLAIAVFERVLPIAEEGEVVVLQPG